MTLCQYITTGHGENPMQFFWVLRDDESNEHLSYIRQNRIWRDTLKEEEWFKPFADRANLIMISDNGDLVFDVAGDTLLANSRSGNFETYPISVDEFLTCARNLDSRILPPDL